jgi:hypothetical protein
LQAAIKFEEDGRTLTIQFILGQGDMSPGREQKDPSLRREGLDHKEGTLIIGS